MTARIVGAALLTVVATALLAIHVVSLPLEAARPAIYRQVGSCAQQLRSIEESLRAPDLRAGDVVQTASMDRLSRIEWSMRSAHQGEHVVISLKRGGRQMQLAQTISGSVPLGVTIVDLISKLVFFIVGLIVLWRGRDAASFLFGVFCLSIAAYINPAFGILPPDWRPAYGIATTTAADIAALTFYFTLETLTRGLIPRPAVIATRSIVIASLALTTANDLGYAGFIKTGCVNLPLFNLHFPAVGVWLAATFAYFAAAYAASRDAQRQRLRWIFWSTAIGLSGEAAYVFGHFLDHPLTQFGLEQMTGIAIPLGYSYAILKHRVIDVNFVLNRALIYAALTSGVVAIFSLIDLLLSTLTVGHRATVWVELIVALTLGLLLDPIQHKVRAVVERIFFRRKLENEEALRRLARDTAFIENEDALLERVTNEVSERTDATGVAIYQQSDKGYSLVKSAGTIQFPPDVGVDDAAFVRLRSTLDDVDLGEVGGRLSDTVGPGFAFPLTSRGTLTGALICGPEKHEEPYTPDDREVLRQVARALAAAMMSLHSRDQAELLEAFAGGSIDAETARARAKDLMG